MERTKILFLENVRIDFRNFSGKLGEYNRNGDRNFCVMLDDRVDVAKELEDAGWNIKWLKPRDPDDAPCPYISVKVSFKKYMPTIYLIDDGKRARITEKNIGNLDWAEIENADGQRNRVDLEVDPYVWSMGGKSGITAYCRALYIPLAADHFRNKYRDIPEDNRSLMFGEDTDYDD